MYQPQPLVSALNRSFAALPAPDLPRTRFNLSHKNTKTLDAGKLVPILVDDLLPSDTVSVTPRIFGRLLTALAPTMDNLYVDWHAFFVPHRLVWDNWQKFMGERVDPDDSIDYTVPVLCKTSAPWQFALNGVADHFGYPVLANFSNLPDHPSLPTALNHRAYRLIWNEWFRDENLQDSITVPRGDGPDDPTVGGYDALTPRGKRHTYITSCLPWPQKGDSVPLPLGDSAPVVGNGTQLGLSFGAGGMHGLQSNAAQFSARYSTGVGAPTGAGAGTPYTFPDSYMAGVSSNPLTSGLIALLDQATAADINSLRSAIAIQQMLESDARGGTRYTEILRRDFGSIVPDFRLQRPEYIYGGSERINMTAVADTTADGLGNLGGVAVAGMRGHFTYSAVEHGTLMILLSVRADLRFQQRLDRRWTRRTRYDYYRHEMAHLGEQPVYGREVMYQAGDVGNEEVWGYQERWAEYRYYESIVSGSMRSIAPQSLDLWHYALHYGSRPPLNGAFIEDNPDIDRTIAITEGEPQFKFDVDLDYFATRVLPAYSVPGLLRL